MKTGTNNFTFSILVILSLVGFFACDTARNVEDPDLHYFVKYYGGDGNQQGVDMLALSDGSFLLLGNYSENPFDTDIYLIRVDAEGEVMWEQRFGQDVQNIFNAKDIEPTTDGNFVVLSDFQTTDSLVQVRLLKISPDGILLDSEVFGTMANDYGKSVTPLPGGDYIVSGSTEFTDDFSTVNNPDPDLGNFFDYRLDQNLRLVTDPNRWSPDILGIGGKLDGAIKAVEGPPASPPKVGNVYYVFGYSNGNISDENPFKKLGLTYYQRDPDGTQSKVVYPGNIVNVDDTQIHFVQPVNPAIGSGVILIGTSKNSLGVSDIFIARLRSTLIFEEPFVNDITLYQTVPTGRNIRGVSATSAIIGGSGYIVVGNEVRSEQTTNIWVSKIDQSGIIQWSSTFGSEAEEDVAAAVAELPDGKILILGTMGLADNQSKMALIKVNPKGQLLK